MRAAHLTLPWGNGRARDSGRSDASERVDLRLLVPALAGWSALVGTPGLSPASLAGLSAASAAMAWVARRRWWHRPAGSMLALTGLVVALLCASSAGQGAVRQAGPIPKLALERAIVKVEGTVSKDPRILPDDPERPARVVTELVVHEVVARGVRTAVQTPVLVIGESAWSELGWHDRVRVTGRLTPAAPGEQVVAIMSPRGPPVRTERAGPAIRVADHVRGNLRRAVSDLPPDPRGLVPALVIGDRSLTPATLTDDMKATGMTHLSAVSGSNVAIVLAGVLWVCRLAGLPRRWRPWLAGVALIGFVVLTRPDPSVLRAAVMGAIGLGGMIASRRSVGVPALSAVVVVLLCVDPGLARSYGFALSVLATLGLLLLARPVGDAMARCLPTGLRPLADAVAIPLAAQAATAPVLVLLQGSVTVVAVLANMLAAPLVAPATILGVLVAVLASVAAPLGALAAWGAAAPAEGIARVAHALAKTPMGTVPWPDGTGGALALAGVILLVILCGPWVILRLRRYPWLLTLPALLVAVLLWPLSQVGWPPAGWRFAACDVGQGDALVIATGPGRAVVVDAGPREATVSACLDRLAVRAVDAMVLTHYHADHVSGVTGVFAGRPVGAVFATPIEEPADNARQVSDLVRAAGLAITPIASCDVLVWGDVVVEPVWPARRVSAGSVPNNAGVVLDVRAPGLRVVLMGDVEREAGAEIRRGWGSRCGTATGPDPPDPRLGPPEGSAAGGGADRPDRPVGPTTPVVVKIAHHGSANQDPGLLRLLAPAVGVISVGADNDYGHPAQSVLRLLAEIGATVYRTDRDGDVVVAVDDAGVTVTRQRP
ncbi:MAG TPA: ComEC/Rec2 family competence protein [Dermatophilaceae bacterium]|nr:ComEC/Rec2 family competence protein [Dermatophilaceae bacterium]